MLNELFRVIGESHHLHVIKQIHCMWNIVFYKPGGSTPQCWLPEGCGISDHIPWVWPQKYLYCSNYIGSQFIPHTLVPYCLSIQYDWIMNNYVYYPICIVSSSQLINWDQCEEYRTWYCPLLLDHLSHGGPPSRLAAQVRLWTQCLTTKTLPQGGARNGQAVKDYHCTT